MFFQVPPRAPPPPEEVPRERGRQGPGDRGQREVNERTANRGANDC